MSKPLTEVELDAITAQVKGRVDSADEGMCEMALVREMNPEDARRIYNLEAPS